MSITNITDITIGILFIILTFIVANMLEKNSVQKGNSVILTNGRKKIKYAWNIPIKFTKFVFIIKIFLVIVAVLGIFL
jgi:hypothetical protein